MTKDLIEHTPGTANHFRLTAAGKEAKAAARRPQITGVHVDCVSYDRMKAAAGFTLGEHRYHLWFDPRTMKDEGTLYKNLAKQTTREERRSLSIKLNPNAASNRPMIAEMWRQIAEGDMIAEAIRMRAYEDVEDEAERDNRQFDLHRSFGAKAQEIIDFIERASATVDKQTSAEAKAMICAAMEWAQGQ